MSQISPPIRILLVAVIGLIAVYMLFLRPKTEEAVPVAAAPAATSPVPAKDPNATPSSKPGTAVNQAVRGADSASARADAAAGGAVAEAEGGTVPTTTGATATAPTTAAPVNGESGVPAPITKKTLATLPKDVRGAVRKHQVLVLLFYNNRSADDRAVRRALNKVNRYGGQVFVDAHWIKSVSRYQAITRGADVEQSPTVIVADRNLKSETLVGYVDAKTIDQAVVDAIRASGGSLIKSPYFRKLDRICASVEQRVKALAPPAAPATIPAFLIGVQGITGNAEKQIAAIKPPQKHKVFHKRFKAYAATSSKLVGRAATTAKSNPAAARKRLTRQGKTLDKKFVAKNGAHGLGANCF